MKLRVIREVLSTHPYGEMARLRLGMSDASEIIDVSDEEATMLTALGTLYRFEQVTDEQISDEEIQDFRCKSSPYDDSF